MLTASTYHHPAATDTAATNSSSPTPSPPPFLGCMKARGALLDGQALVREAQPSAEDCCRACRAWNTSAMSNGTACQVFNYCGLEGGCRYEDPGGSGTVALAQGECE